MSRIKWEAGMVGRSDKKREEREIRAKKEEDEERTIIVVRRPSIRPKWLSFMIRTRARVGSVSRDGRSD